MTIKPAAIVEYAKEIQRLDIAPDRAQKVAGELVSLVDGIFALAGGTAFADDPQDFLATLADLRDKSGAIDD